MRWRSSIELPSLFWSNIELSTLIAPGAVVVNASGYEGAGNFSEGLAAVFDRHKGWGFIDKTGAVVIQPRFEGSLGFRDGLAPVVLAGKWGFIVLAFAWIYVRYGTLPQVAGVLYGVKPVIIVLCHVEQEFETSDRVTNRAVCWSGVRNF